MPAARSDHVISRGGISQLVRPFAEQASPSPRRRAPGFPHRAILGTLLPQLSSD